MSNPNRNLLTSLFRIESHPTARSRAVASSTLSEGTAVMSTPPMATVLLDSEKGQRCDSCLRVRANLKRCTACQNYWYCDSICQMIAWKSNHRRLCQPLLSFTSSAEYGRLSSPEKLHSLLLAHLLAEHGTSLSLAFPGCLRPDLEDLSDPISTILHLLPQPDYKSVVPTVDLKDPTIPDSLVTFLSSRFANNNFTIHCARMTVFAHGVFPLASRSFNHSCVPCAVPVYRHAKESKRVIMEIRLLRTVDAGEEITIPYTDPALPYATRRLDLKLTYGFTCECFLCRQDHSPVAPATSPAQLTLWESGVRQKFSSIIRQGKSPSLEMRESFLRNWHPSYLPPLAEAFSNTSHDGPYTLALQQGATLLSVYEAIYPSNFPITGLHALELAKTCWNAFVTRDMRQELLQDMEIYLTKAERTLGVLFEDSTGDWIEEEGPLSEVKVMRQMLSSETGRINLHDAANLGPP